MRLVKPRLGETNLELSQWEGEHSSKIQDANKTIRFPQWHHGQPLHVKSWPTNSG